MAQLEYKNDATACHGNEFCSTMFCNDMNRIIFFIFNCAIQWTIRDLYIIHLSIIYKRNKPLKLGLMHYDLEQIINQLHKSTSLLYP